MTPDVYKFDISRTDQTVDLYALIADILEDETLATTEKDELLQFITGKFGQLNARAASSQPPRWQL